MIVTVGDLREEAVAKDVVKHTLDKFGRVDVLVNAAGILINGTAEDCAITEFDRIFDVNVRRCARTNSRRHLQLQHRAAHEAYHPAHRRHERHHRQREQRGGQLLGALIPLGAQAVHSSPASTITA